ncbi:folylpolyglutamate synthase/dihydrofolate synthase family protein [Lachnospiraceae bacterium 62-35]
MSRAEEIRYTGDAEEYLLQIPMFTKEKHSLSEIQRIFERIGRIPKGRIIHVAGTNGKGSVCAFLASVLKKAGYRTGVFTSPHLCNMRERIAIDGEIISRRDFEHAFRLVLGDVRDCMKDGMSHPAFFEFLFYMAMVYFCEKQADYIILETGLGGRLDATNICHPVVSVITSVSMDHMEYLGDTLEAIAREKAGIIKKGIPVVFSAASPVVRAVIEKRAEELSAPCLSVFPKDYETDLCEEGLQVRTSWKEKEGEQKELSFTISIPAPYQGENAVLALRALAVLDAGISADMLISGMEQARWPGRMEQLLPGIYLDGAHNVDGILKFTQAVNALLDRSVKTPGKGPRKARLLFAVAKDKEYEKMAEILCKNTAWLEIFTTRIDNGRGFDEDRIRRTLESCADCPVKAFPSSEEAFLEGLRCKKEDELLFCAGSLYFVGEIKEILEKYGYH